MATSPSAFDMLARDCVTPANLRRVLVRIYFVASNNLAGDGIPTLKRAELAETGSMQIVPLVEGIENLQFEYGLDHDADGVLEAFDSCAACTDTDFFNAVAVRVHVLARNLEPTSGYSDGKRYALGGVAVGPLNDGYKRHVFSQFVQLANPAGRRE